MASVIIDTYNLAPFIEEAVESVLRQTFPEEELEIIVVDDGSTDDTGERVKQYGNKISYLYKANGGQASALNAGFENSRGEIIFLLDGDDYFHPDKVRDICDVYDRYHCDSVFHDLTVFGNEIIHPYRHLDSYYLSLMDRIDSSFYRVSANGRKPPPFILSPTSGQSYKRQIGHKIFPIPESFSHYADLYCYMTSLMHCNIYYRHKAWTYFRRHPASIEALSARDVNLAQRAIDLKKSLVQILKKYPPDERADRLLRILENGLQIRSVFLERRKGKPLEALRHWARCRIEGPLPFRFFSVLHLILFLLAPQWLYDRLKRAYRKSGLKTQMTKILKRQFPF